MRFLKRFIRDLRWFPIILIPAYPVIFCFCLDRFIGSIWFLKKPPSAEQVFLSCFVMIATSLIVYTAVLFLRCLDIRRKNCGASTLSKKTFFDDEIEGRNSPAWIFLKFKAVFKGSSNDRRPRS
jgi:hypothetical protein